MDRRRVGFYLFMTTLVTFGLSIVGLVIGQDNYSLAMVMISALTAVMAFYITPRPEPTTGRRR